MYSNELNDRVDPNQVSNKRWNTEDDQDEWPMYQPLRDGSRSRSKGRENSRAFDQDFQFAKESKYGHAGNKYSQTILRPLHQSHQSVSQKSLKEDHQNSIQRPLSDSKPNKNDS